MNFNQVKQYIREQLRRPHAPLIAVCVAVFLIFLVNGWITGQEQGAHFAAKWASVATVLSFIIGGYWVYHRYLREEENYSQIEFETEVKFIGAQADAWIIELIGHINNKGRVRHEMRGVYFNVAWLTKGDPIQSAAEHLEQVFFPHENPKRWVTSKGDGFFIGRECIAKYSYVDHVPKNATFVLVHANFEYGDRNAYHAAECTVRVPQDEGMTSLNDHSGKALKPAVVAG